MTVIAELQSARETQRLALKNIGEPLVEIPTDFLSVSTDATGTHVWITMESLIHVVEGTLQKTR